MVLGATGSLGTVVVGGIRSRSGDQPEAETDHQRARERRDALVVRDGGAVRERGAPRA
jgi:hypothetical protein